MKLAVIILNYKTPQLLKKVVMSVVSRKWENTIEVWMVDNDSQDESVAMIKKEFPQVKLVASNKNLGFAGGNNLALKEAKADYYMLLNSDAEVTNHSLDTMLSFMQKNNFDMITCKIVNPDGSFQADAGDLPFGFALFNWLFGIDDLLPFLKLPSFHRKDREYFVNNKEVEWVAGTAIIFTKEVLEKVGLWDDRIFMYGEDVDYCIRVRKKGFRIGWTDEATIVHIGGGSSADPHLRQWLGEFKGILYLYKKYKGPFATFVIRLVIYIAIVLRIIMFFLVGKKTFASTYFKVLTNL